jgi:hypothetical protein
MNHKGLHLLNQAYVVLIPKKQNATKVNDCRPISLIHSFAKILSKLLAIRLGSKLNQLISISQKRCIHDNFVFVQQVIKDLHEKRIIKLDISKVFDTVNWSYMLSILQHLGFGQMWRNWISLLWCTTSSCYLLNG